MRKPALYVLLIPLFIWLICAANIIITASFPPKNINTLLEFACHTNATQIVLVESKSYSGKLSCEEAKSLAIVNTIEWAQMTVLSSKAVNLFIFWTDVQCTYSADITPEEPDVECVTYTDAL